MEERVAVVCGRRITLIDGDMFRATLASYDRVVVDLGTGDARWAYRLARGHPYWGIVAIDPNVEGMRRTSFQAGRKPARGGAPNIRFVRASVQTLPQALIGSADEVHVHFPWAGLLHAVTAADRDALRRIAGLGKPGARLCVRINLSALPGLERVSRLQAAYAACGMRVRATIDDSSGPATSWGGRLGCGRPIPLLVVDGRMGGIQELS